MTQLPIKTFTEIMADFERYEGTRQFAEKLKEWLGSLQRTADDVHIFSFSRSNSVELDKIDLRFIKFEWQYSTWDAFVTFKDGGEAYTTRIALNVNGADLCSDAMKALDCNSITEPKTENDASETE